VMRAALAQTLATAGRREQALLILEELTTLAKQKYVSPYFLAGIYVGLGEPDRAMKHLEKACEDHSHWLMYLHLDPGMDALRSETRFQDLLRRIGLPLQSASV
jgi:tetratricopeptide (TPR) repeat protein